MAKPYYDQGLHIGEVLSQGFTKAKTGTTQFVLVVKIMGIPCTPPVEGNYDAHHYQYERKIYMPMTEKTSMWVGPKLERMGFVGNRVSELDPSSPHHQSFVGNLIELWCNHKDDQNGNLQENWQISDGGTVSEPLESKDLRKLDALFGKALKSAPRTAVQQPSTTQYTDQGITDDDIPF